MDNVNAFTGETQLRTAPTRPATSGAAKPAKKFEVDDFLITGAKVHFNGTGHLPLPRHPSHRFGQRTGWHHRPPI